MSDKIMDHILLDMIYAMSRHMDGREVIRAKGKLLLTDPMSFCSAATTLVDKGRATDVIYLGFFKSFDVVP